MKSDTKRGSSSSQTRQDDTGLNVNDNESHWRLTTHLILTNLSYHTDNITLEKRFIVSERYRYRSWKYMKHKVKTIQSASTSRLPFDRLDSRRRGFV